MATVTDQAENTYTFILEGNVKLGVIPQMEPPEKMPR